MVMSVLRKRESRWRWNILRARISTSMCHGRARKSDEKGTRAWVRRHGRTNRGHPPLQSISSPLPPVANRIRKPRERPFVKPDDSPVPLSLARTRDLSQAFRRLNGLKWHTGAHLPVTPNPMHLRAETFPPRLAWICLAGKTRLDTRGETWADKGL